MSLLAYEILSSTPIGPVLVAVGADGLTAVGFGPRSVEGLLAKAARRLPGRRFAKGQAARTAAHALREYFEERSTLFDLPLDLSVGTPFQQAVWRATAEVPWGQPATYGEIAISIGNPGASRAVGNALGRNPIPIIVPCHRVLAAGARLGGFSGGLWFKRKLLALEGFNVIRS